MALGEALASALGYTPVYLRCNSGLYTSQNWHELSTWLGQLVSCWPTPINELSVVGHSMGGWLISSAFYHAKKEFLCWPARQKHIVFLGAPYHGAPLERAGNWVDAILDSTTLPGHDRFRCQPDNRQIMPLPEGVACYAVAATTAAKLGIRADRLMDDVIGDSLAPLHSATCCLQKPRNGLLIEQTTWRC